MQISLRMMTLTTYTRAIVVGLALSGGVVAPLSAQRLSEIMRWLDGGSETLYLRVRDGQWSYQSPRVPTATWKFSGEIRIRTPREGKWRIRLVDLVRPPERGYPPIVDEIVEANQIVPFSYRTGGTAQLSAQLTWTRQEDAIAYVDLTWDGCLCVMGSHIGDKPHEPFGALR